MKALLLREKIAKSILKYDPPHLTGHLKHAVKDSLILRTSTREEDGLPVGTSKLSGRPDLQANTE
jgi:hypothetical protein